MLKFQKPTAVDEGDPDEEEGDEEEEEEEEQEEEEEDGKDSETAPAAEEVPAAEEGEVSPRQNRLDNISEEGGNDEAVSHHESDDETASLPVMSAEQFNQYMRSLIKLLVGENTLLNWIKRGMTLVTFNFSAMPFSLLLLYFKFCKRLLQLALAVTNLNTE